MAESNGDPAATVKAILLIFPNAKSFYQSYLEFRKHYTDLSLSSIVRSARDERQPSGWKKHPQACPGIKAKGK